VGFSARVDQIANDLALSRRIPSRRARAADHGRLQGFSTPPISGPKVGATHDLFSCHLDVVAKGCSEQRGTTFVDLGETHGREELVLSRHRGCSHLITPYFVSIRRA
jgi:hypothetical protein